MKNFKAAVSAIYYFFIVSFQCSPKYSVLSVWPKWKINSFCLNLSQSHVLLKQDQSPNGTVFTPVTISNFSNCYNFENVLVILYNLFQWFCYTTFYISLRFIWCTYLEHCFSLREKQEGQVSPRNFISDSCPPLSPNENSWSRKWHFFLSVCLPN